LDLTVEIKQEDVQELEQEDWPEEPPAAVSSSPNININVGPEGKDSAENKEDFEEIKYDDPELPLTAQEQLERFHELYGEKSDKEKLKLFAELYIKVNLISARFRWKEHQVTRLATAGGKAGLKDTETELKKAIMAIVTAEPPESSS
jgi:hypothetical protein